MLAALRRARGLRLVVVSNWDVSLHEVLARTGLARSSTAPSPPPRSARRSPTRRRCSGPRSAGDRDAVLVGDDVEEDAGAAEAAGLHFCYQRP